MGTEHPDEGTIHAWLDGALDEGAAERVAAHVAGCARCADAVAEARGLIAGASRVVRALDGDAGAGAAGTGPAWGSAPASPAAPRPTSPSWLPRVTPMRAAVAATLLVVAGLTLTHDWAARESAVLPPPAQVAVGSAPAAVLSAAAPRRDPLLDSAIRRNVETALPPRRLDRAPGPTVALAPEVPPSPLATDSSAQLKVAEGRVATRAARDTAPAAVDVARAPLAVAAAPMAASAMAPARAAEAGVSARSEGAGVQMRKAASKVSSGNIMDTSSRQCYDILASGGGGADTALHLPLRLRIEGQGDSGLARVIEGGAPAAPAMRWSRQGADSLRLELGATVLSVGRAGGEGRGVVARPADCR